MPEDIYSILEKTLKEDTALQKKFCDVVQIDTEKNCPYVSRGIGDIFNDNQLIKYQELIKCETKEKDPETSKLIISISDGLVLNYELLNDLILRCIDVNNIPLTESLIKLLFKVGDKNLLPSSKDLIFNNLLEILRYPYRNIKLKKLICDYFVTSKTYIDDSISSYNEEGCFEGLVLKPNHLSFIIKNVLPNYSAQQYDHEGFVAITNLISEYKDDIEKELIKESLKIVERDFCPVTGGDCSKKEKISQRETFFLAHDFNRSFFPVDSFRGILKEILEEKTKLKMTYVKDSGMILCNACKLIRSSQFGIYDMSDMSKVSQIIGKEICSEPKDFCKRARSNVNVSIELGLALGFGKKAITLNAPSNLVDGGGFSTIPYDNLDDLKNKLENKNKEYFIGEELAET